MAEVEDGGCTDNFFILANGADLYSFVGDRNPATVVRTHRVLIPAADVTYVLTVTFRNASTDNCDLAAVYDVRLTPA